MLTHVPEFCFETIQGIEEERKEAAKLTYEQVRSCKPWHINNWAIRVNFKNIML